MNYSVVGRVSFVFRPPFSSTNSSYSVFIGKRNVLGYTIAHAAGVVTLPSPSSTRSPYNASLPRPVILPMAIISTDFTASYFNVTIQWEQFQQPIIPITSIFTGNSSGNNVTMFSNNVTTVFLVVQFNVVLTNGTIIYHESAIYNDSSRSLQYENGVPAGSLVFVRTCLGTMGTKGVVYLPIYSGFAFANAPFPTFSSPHPSGPMLYSLSPTSIYFSWDPLVHFPPSLVLGYILTLSYNGSSNINEGGTNLTHIKHIGGPIIFNQSFVQPDKVLASSFSTLMSYTPYTLSFSALLPSSNGTTILSIISPVVSFVTNTSCKLIWRQAMTKVWPSIRIQPKIFTLIGTCGIKCEKWLSTLPPFQ